MKPKCVLHVSDKLTIGDAQLHGVTRVLAWWLPAFDPAEFRMIGGSLRGRDAAGEYLEKAGVSMRYLNRSSFDPRSLPALAKLARAERVDLLHMHGYGATNFGRLVAQRLGIPCIVHEHIVDEHMPAVQKLADRALSGLTSWGIAISESVKDFMARDRAVPRDRIDVIYNGIPLDAYLDESEEGSGRASVGAAWKREAGIPDHHRVVTIVGRLNELKGHRYFLEAAAELREDFRDLSFAIVGDGESQALLEARARELGIAERVFFLGHRDDVAAILAGSDISVVASLSEGGPLVLFEAMAARCATIVTRTCGLSELIEDGRNGFVVPPRDAAAIAARLQLLLEDAQLSKEIGERARRDAFGYDVESTVAKFQGIYRKLLA